MGSISSWSDLPLELLSMISNSLKTRIDISRFRSVCSSWRSSTPPFKSPIQFPFDLDVELEFPIDLDDNSYNSDYFRITEKAVYCLEPRTPQPSLSMNNWLIVLNEFQDGRKVHLLNPLTGFPIQPLPSVFPNELDLSNFHIIELKKLYRLELNMEIPRSSFTERSSIGKMYMIRKVVFLPNPTYDKPLLAVLQYYGCLSFFKLENNWWTLVHDIGNWSDFKDIGSYKGKVCAISYKGNAIIVDSSFNVAEIAKPSHEKIHYRYLVESSNDLYLVEVDECFIEGVRKNFILVYKLHELDGHKWSKVTEIGGQVFFIGQMDDMPCWSFSVPSHQIPSCKGNCIFFGEYLTSYHEQNSLNECYETLVREDKDMLSVFDMETGKYGLLWQFPGYADVFWPPPEWLNVGVTSK